MRTKGPFPRFQRTPSDGCARAAVHTPRRCKGATRPRRGGVKGSRRGTHASAHGACAWRGGREAQQLLLLSDGVHTPAEWPACHVPRALRTSTQPLAATGSGGGSLTLHWDAWSAGAAGMTPLTAHTAWRQSDAFCAWGGIEGPRQGGLSDASTSRSYTRVHMPDDASIERVVDTMRAPIAAARNSWERGIASLACKPTCQCLTSGY